MVALFDPSVTVDKKFDVVSTKKNRRKARKRIARKI
jgi:hypothetical protein